MVSPNHAQVETVNIDFVQYSSPKLLNATRPTKPPPNIMGWSFVVLLVGPGGKNRNDIWLILIQVLVLKINAMPVARVDISYA